MIGRALRLLLGHLDRGRTLLTLLTALAIRRRGVADDTLLLFDLERFARDRFLFTSSVADENLAYFLLRQEVFD